MKTSTKNNSTTNYFLNRYIKKKFNAIKAPTERKREANGGVA